MLLIEEPTKDLTCFSARADRFCDPGRDQGKNNLCLFLCDRMAGLLFSPTVYSVRMIRIIGSPET